MHEKVAETVAGVYSHIVKLRSAVADYVKIMEFSEEPDKKERRKVVGERLGEFHDFYQPNKIYLSKNVIPKIEELEKILTDTAREFMWKVERPDRPNEGHGDAAAWGEAHTTIAEHVPPVLAALEDEFRALLGHTNATGVNDTRLTPTSP